MSGTPHQVAPPLLYEWQGDGWRPVGHYARLADRHFTIGEQRLLSEHHVRSRASHNHYFAQIEEAWRQLPEHLVDLHPTPERLRKYALVTAGFIDEPESDVFVFASSDEALRQLGRMSRKYDLVTISGQTLTCLVAESQSYRTMGKQRFQQSKERSLDVIWALVGVTPADGSANTGKAA